MPLYIVILVIYKYGEGHNICLLGGAWWKYNILLSLWVVQSALDVSGSKFVINCWCLVVSFLVPVNLLRDTSNLG